MGTMIKRACLFCLFGGIAFAQMQKDYLIQKRGMLNQTMYNTGELGRKYVTSNANTELGIPSFEWPANSATIVDTKQYTGQHNSYGGGVQISADRVDSTQRLYAYCGGLLNEVAEYVNSFPLSQERIENYPLLADGSLNPSYNPDEAEEIIISKWATPVGITITRTSRAWSFPDYDDFIIYEYVFENTGDLTGKQAIPARPVRLKDVIINFSHGLTGGKFGYDRTSNSWAPTVVEKKDYNARFDPRRWLQYGLHRDGNPEPKYFAEWALSGKNGGGLLSPQASGYMCLYVDTTHLVHKGDGTRVSVETAAWDPGGHVKQPYTMRMETSQQTVAKTQPSILDVTQVRKQGAYTTNIFQLYGKDSLYWLGRGSLNWRQSTYFAIGRNYAFGPYNLEPGEKLTIAIAELSGYGAARKEETAAGVKDVGGSNGQNNVGGWTAEAGDALYAFYTVPNYWEPKAQNLLNPNSVNTIPYGSDYLSKYSLPDYVNSNVVTVREVADRAIQAYGGEPLVNHDSVQHTPEKYSDHGVYRIPIPIPAPAITLENTVLGENKIVWGPQVESFATPRLQGTFDHYELYKASHPLGPWTKLVSVSKSDPLYFTNGKYQFVDKNSRIGDYFYYSVLSVDNNGNRSGRTNMTLHQSSIGAETTLKKVFVTPNPFIVKSGQSGESVGGDINSQLRFYNLPRTCTIRIYSYSGQLVQTIAHDEDKNNHPYFQITRNNQLIASGVYFYVVDASDGSRCHGKFVIIN
ncbi:MAG: hypothetical protein NTV54_14485 [Ignavibacteriales bacterium]|nr:hypothetical protein [Ignavibacteriales bacterium]